MYRGGIADGKWREERGNKRDGHSAARDDSNEVRMVGGKLTVGGWRLAVDSKRKTRAAGIGRAERDRVVLWTGGIGGQARRAGSGIRLCGLARRIVKVRSGK